MADRTWIESRAIAFALGELDESDEQRFREAVADDPEYADLDALRDPDAVGHVPAALVARWDSQGRNLRDAERDLVEHHLHSCDDCREDLELLRRITPSGSGPRIVRPRDWMPWFGGAVLGAAAVLAFLVLSPGISPVTQGQHLEVISPRATRGPDTPVYVLESTARAFLLAVALPTDLETGSTLELIAPDGSVLLERPLDPARSAQVLVLADGVFETGEYAVQVRISGDGGVRDLGRFMIERPD